MKCPFCGEIDNKVIDSRLSKDASVIRRRRECIDCSRRFTTYEHIEEIPIMIINAGIVKIYYRSGYADFLAKELLAEANIELKQIESDNQGEG